MFNKVIRIHLERGKNWMIYVNVRAIIERQGAMGTEIVIQKRMKSYEAGTPYELPGGRLKTFESYIDGLKREVYEETGLHVTKIFGEETKFETKEVDSKVEIMKPFAIYQTTKGPVDSLGAYFRCIASGELLTEGDDTADIKWISVEELDRLLTNNLIDFSWVDRAGIMYYLHEYFENRS